MQYIHEYVYKQIHTYFRYSVPFPNIFRFISPLTNDDILSCKPRPSHQTKPNKIHKLHYIQIHTYELYIDYVCMYICQIIAVVLVMQTVADPTPPTQKDDQIKNTNIRRVLFYKLQLQQIFSNFFRRRLPYRICMTNIALIAEEDELCTQKKPIPNLVLGIHYYTDMVFKKSGAKFFTLKTLLCSI